MDFTVDRKSWRRADLIALWAGLAIYTLLNFARRTFLSANATAAIWPAAGLLAVTFLLAPRKTWGLILGVAVANNISTNMIWGFSARTLPTIPEAVLMAFMIRKVCPPSLNFADPLTLVKFIGGAVFPACAASAAMIWLLPSEHANGFVALRWFTGHAIGAAITVPAFVTLLRPRRFHAFNRPTWELLLVCAGLLLYVVKLFSGHDAVLALMVFPMAMTVAFRYGPVGAATMSSLMMAAALVKVYAGAPAPTPLDWEQVEWVQVFVAIVFLTSLPAAGALASLRRTRRLLARRTETARLARRRADEAALAKTRFLANMSHEIRTPLNGVIGLADGLSRTTLAPPQREMVDMIQSSGRALNGILSDVLDLARADAGGLRLTPEPFDAGDAVSAASYLFESIAQRKRVAFEVDFDLAYRGAVVGDALRIRQIISNLISNAVKFTQEGKVQVQARLAPNPTDPALADLTVSVADTGPGFDDEVRARLFRRFEQADNSVARRYGGTGLGLAISRELAEMMGGSIDCRSEPGRGAIFTLRVSLPTAAERAPQVEPAPEPATIIGGVRRPSVLLAEDHPVNQRVIQAILGESVELTIVEDGKAAVDACAAYAFDLILMDTQMPVMDGLAAIRQIRAMEAHRVGLRMPIISLTADALPHQVQDALSAGADRHLPKPITAAALLGCMNSVIEHKAA